VTTKTWTWTAAAVVLAAVGGLASARSPIITILALAGFISFVAVSHNRPAATIVLFPLTFLPWAAGVFGQLIGPSDLLLILLGGTLLVEWATGRQDGSLLGHLSAPAIGFVAWTAASAVWAADPLSVAIETTQRAAFIGLGIAVVHALPTDGRVVRRGLGGMVALAAVLGAVETVAAIVTHTYLHVYGLGIHKNWYGFVLPFGIMVLAALAFEQRRRVTGRWLVPLLPMVTGLAVSGSRGGWIGTLVGLTVIVIFHRPAFAWPAITAGVLAVGLVFVAAPQLTTDKIDTSTADTSAGMRMRTWAEGVRAVKEAPLFGEGAGNFVAVVKDRGSQVDPNNLTLLTWAETGIFGLAFLGWLFVAAARTAARNARTLTGTAALANTAGAAIFVSSVAHAQFDMFWTRGVALLTFMGIGLIVWASRQVNPSASEPSRSLIPLGAP
jgi:O-antigen ligase